MSAPSISYQVVGVKAALRDLGRLEPELRKSLQASFKAELKPLADKARQDMPAQAPLSGMEKPGRLQYTNKARTGVKIATSGRNRRAGTLTVAALVNTNAAGAVFDMAGRKTRGVTPQGVGFIAGLSNRFGNASRTLWPTVERNEALIERAVDNLVNGVETEITRRLAQ